MSSKRPNTCGRIASSSNGPTSVATCAFEAETVKWLHQNSVQRSRKPASVSTASLVRARKSWPASARIILRTSFTGSKSWCAISAARFWRW